MWPSEEGPSIIDFSQPQKLATEDGKSFITQLRVLSPKNGTFLESGYRV